MGKKRGRQKLRHSTNDERLFGQMSVNSILNAHFYESELRQLSAFDYLCLNWTAVYKLDLIIF